MPNNFDQNIIIDLLAKLSNIANELIKLKPYFTILSEKDLPKHPPRMHTRSISWLAEEVIRQNLDAFKDQLNIQFIDEPASDILPYDCVLKMNDIEHLIYINFKVSDYNRGDDESNDISEITQLIDFFSITPKPLLFEMIFKIKFDEFNVFLDAKKPIVFFLPWLSGWIINKSQHKVQAAYIHEENKINEHDFLVSLLEKAIDPVNKVNIKFKTCNNIRRYINRDLFNRRIKNFIESKLKEYNEDLQKNLVKIMKEIDNPEDYNKINEINIEDLKNNLNSILIEKSTRKTSGLFTVVKEIVQRMNIFIEEGSEEQFISIFYDNLDTILTESTEKDWKLKGKKIIFSE